MTCAPFHFASCSARCPTPCGGAVDEHGGVGVEWHRAVLRRLEGRGVVVSELDQELPRGESGHGCPGGVYVVDADGLRARSDAGAATYWA